MALGLAFGAGVPAASAQAPAGDATYKTQCAACHDSTSPRVPTRAALQQMPAARILRALEGGAMMNVALTMSHDERVAVANYLGRPGAVEGPPPSAFCAARTGPLAWNVHSRQPLSVRMAWTRPAALPTNRCPSSTVGCEYADTSPSKPNAHFSFRRATCSALRPAAAAA